MKRNLLPLYTMLLLALSFSCSDDDTTSNHRQKAVLNIDDAQSLAVLSNANGRIDESNPQINLYKITTDGSFETVKFVNADGSEVTDGTPQYIKVTDILDINEDYLVLKGIFMLWDTLGSRVDYQSLLVRKTDGAIFDFSGTSVDTHKYKRGEKLFPEDASGNIYFADNIGVVKINLANPDQLSKMDYLPTGQTAYFFNVDASGNCLYEYNEQFTIVDGGFATSDFRIRKASGGVAGVEVDGRYNIDSWTGTDGSIYFTTYAQDNYGYKSAIHKVKVVNDVVEIDDVWAATDYEAYSAMGARRYNDNSVSPCKIQKENSVLFVGRNGGSNQSWEFDEINKSVKLITLPNFQQDYQISYSDKYYYIADNTNLYKIDLETHAYVNLLDTDQYEVYAMTVSSNDIVQFSGLRFSDGKKIFAQINASGQLSILDEELDKEATILQRLD